MGTRSTLNDELARLGPFNTSRVMASAKTFEHLDIAPFANHNAELIFTILRKGVRFHANITKACYLPPIAPGVFHRSGIPTSDRNRTR